MGGAVWNSVDIMTDIDEISYKLGAIQADLSTVVVSVKELKEYQLRMNGSINKAWVEIEEIKPHVEDYKTNKKRAVMGLIGLGGATGVIGGKIGAWFTAVLG